MEKLTDEELKFLEEECPAYKDGLVVIKNHLYFKLQIELDALNGDDFTMVSSQVMNESVKRIREARATVARLREPLPTTPPVSSGIPRTVRKDPETGEEKT